MQVLEYNISNRKHVLILSYNNHFIRYLHYSVWYAVSGIIYSMCLVATITNRILVLQQYGNEISFSLHILFWIWYTIVPDLLVLLILYILLFHIGKKYPQLYQYGIVVGLGFAVFIILVSSCNILMLRTTGQNMQWKIVFDINLVDAYRLYLTQVSSFLSLLATYFLFGSAIWFIMENYTRTHDALQFSHFQTAKMLTSSLILAYTLIVLFYDVPRPYKNISSNMVLTYIPEIFAHYGRLKPTIPFLIDKSAFNIVIPIIRAPTVNISRPLVTLKKPIKHVFVIVLESIRADALPLNKSFAKVIQETFTDNTTAAKVTPLLNSLWKNSLRTVVSTTASYTLKSLLSIFCGIYPLSSNFLSETSPENLLYEKCLPELLRETFRTSNNRSTFRSAFFTAALDTFDRQRALHENFKFDTVISGSEINKVAGDLPNTGWFGPADSTVLPLMWKWIDNNLVEEEEEEEEETSQLMMGLLVTGTHYPFEIPPDQFYDGNRHYTENEDVNGYLNAMHICDHFLKRIIKGFKSRKLFNDTLFVIVSDHGHTFYDNGRNMYGTLNAPLESAFLVPLMFYNPYFEAKQLDGQFTNMDILPTIMDILLSSKSSQKSTNLLLSVPSNQLQSILSRYEGTSILRMPLEKQPVRYTFHLVNPGNSYIIVKQYPKKLTYNIQTDEVHLYHLEYDPFELIDLIALDSNTEADHPLWIDVRRDKNVTRIWTGRWIDNSGNSTLQNQMFSQNKRFVSNSRLNTRNNSKIQLSDLLDWADHTLELARLWSELIKRRYRIENK